ncbi:MAG TPA: lysophospholipid acyltransferase family protein [Tepiditoga sp.]|nr:lysophospholipid acyltransferase family protein [Tepiditoga sp.]
MLRFIMLVLVVIVYMVYSLFLLVIIGIMKLFKYKKTPEYIQKRVKNFGKTLMFFSGSKIEIIGEENIPEDNCLFVANHQSNFDIPIILSLIEKPMGFIAKKEVKKIPLINVWVSLIKSVYLDRNNIRNAVKAINQAIEYIKEGHSMFVFPEGTRSSDGKLGEFKAGSFKLATKPKVKIVPIVIIDSYKIMKKDSLKINRENVKIVFLEPISTENFTKEEEKSVDQRVRTLIENKLKSYENN